MTPRHRLSVARPPEGSHRAAPHHSRIAEQAPRSRRATSSAQLRSRAPRHARRAGGCPGVEHPPAVHRVRADLHATPVARGRGPRHRGPAPEIDGGVARGPQRVDEVHRRGVRGCAAPPGAASPGWPASRCSGAASSACDEQRRAARVGGGVGEAHLQRAAPARRYGGRQLLVGARRRPARRRGATVQVHGRGAERPSSSRPTTGSRRRARSPTALSGWPSSSDARLLANVEVDVDAGPARPGRQRSSSACAATMPVDDGRRRRPQPPAVRDARCGSRGAGPRAAATPSSAQAALHRADAPGAWRRAAPLRRPRPRP